MMNDGRSVRGAAKPVQPAELEILREALQDLHISLADGMRVWFQNRNPDVEVDQCIMAAAAVVTERLAKYEHLIPSDLPPNSPARPEAIRETIAFLSPVWGLPGRGEADLKTLIQRVEMAGQHLIGHKSCHDPIPSGVPAPPAGSEGNSAGNTGPKSARTRRKGGRARIKPQEADDRYAHVAKWSRERRKNVTLAVFLERECVSKQEHRAWMEWVRHNPRRKPT